MTATIPAVAAAALMIHVMDADGVRQDAEVGAASSRRWRSPTLGGDDGELESLVEAGEEADHEAVDLYAFTSILKRHLDEEARKEFIRVMWEIVFADGELHELEDNLVWRVAELIGVDSRDRVDMRRAAARAAGIAGD